MFPATLGTFVGRGNWLGEIASWLSPGSVRSLGFLCSIDHLLYLFLDCNTISARSNCFRYEEEWSFYSRHQQGKPTQDYLEKTMNRITLLGAVFLALIAILAHYDRSISWGIHRRSAISSEAQLSDFSGCRVRYDEASGVTSSDEAL